MEALLKAQRSAVRKLDLMIESFKIQKHNKYITKDYRKQIKDLEKWWADFSTRHTDLMQTEEQDDQYFEDNNYATILTKYSKYMDSLQSEIKPGNSEPSFSFPSHGRLTTEPNLSEDSDSSDQSIIDTARDWNNEIKSKAKMFTIQHDDIKALLRAIENMDPKTSAGTANAHLELIKVAWNDFRATAMELRILEPFENDDQFAQSFSRAQVGYINAIGKLNDLIINTKKQVKNIELPKLKIPEFDGKISDWKPFIDLFDKMIHSNDSVPITLKVQYLKTSLKNEAAKLVNHLSPTEENYKTCYDLLRRRYDNKRESFGTLMNTILQLPKQKTENSNDLKMLHDTTYECIMSIKNLGIDTSNWDPMMVHILTSKLSQATILEFECQLKNVSEIPTLEKFLTFVENRFMALQSAESKSYGNNMQEKNEKTKNVEKCAICNEKHSIMKCTTFLKLDIADRISKARDKKLCLNCLKDSHRVNECKSNFKCKECKKSHNTLLHLEGKKSVACTTTLQNESPEDWLESENEMDENQMQIGAIQTTSCLSQGALSVLLATALINVKNIDGETILMRALVDHASQSSFITENAAQILKLKRNKVNYTISGIGQHEQGARSNVDLRISPRFKSKYTITTRAIVMPTLAKIHVNTTTSTKNWKHLDNLMLADPSFYTNEIPIDIILGAAEHGKLLCDGLIKGTESDPIAQNTHIGWIISGETDGSVKHTTITCAVSNVELEQQVKRYFESDDVPHREEFTEEEIFCENQYQSTVQRDQNGKYIVKMPFKNKASEPELGESRKRAVATLLQSERRFLKNPDLFQQYKQFLDEYSSLGHMRPSTYDPNSASYYLPHHAVFKESSTTKLRVVFNASHKTSNGKSLNDWLATGPLHQDDMTSLLTRWRTFKIAFTADIEKMYRQIWINEDQTQFQKIVWRNSPKDPICDYELLTVTYGTANAPYLAIRTLKQLALDEAERFPIASQILLNDFYVDDVLSGADSVNEAKTKQLELKKALRTGGFNLRKWSSNSKVLLDTIPTDEHEPLQNNVIKTLGLKWNPISDMFNISIKDFSQHSVTTKRSLLSEIASLYDPLGWIAPVIIKTKQLLQETWPLQLKWDDVLPDYLAAEWNKIKSELKTIEKIGIPRWIHTTKQAKCFLIGFCDASEKAYAAAIYVKTINAQNEVHVSLLIAKSKVAPLKQLTIPKLELCGALLLARLTNQVNKSLNIKFENMYMWTDSKIALAWIQGNPKRWKTFVANKVIKINSIINKENWFHVSSENNPVDCASRGLYPKEFINHKLWWSGPIFLREDLNNVVSPSKFETTHETKIVVLNSNVQITGDVLPSVSSYNKTKRIIAFCLRFTFNCKNKNNKCVGILHVHELQRAEQCILKHIQYEHFGAEIIALRTKNHVDKKSKIKKLLPFLDDDGLLRVGGRLKNAKMVFDAKHQILLPKNSALTTLIINHFHLHMFHGGPKLTEAAIRQRFWIIDGQGRIKTEIRRCFKCARQTAQPLQQLMGDLPAVRVTKPTKPFENCAVDFTGAIHIKSMKGRGGKILKAYISIFVCMATKAIHIELVGDLTAEAFIGAFKRFTARRGVVKNMYSDNGTNFVAANKMLLQAFEWAAEEYEFIHNELAKEQTTWHFSPAGAPHFNGLAEAGVKSVKNLLKKVIGETLFTFEELSTLLGQIEAILNNRPLCPLSTEPNDTEILTPAHFLIGTTLSIPTDESFTDCNTNWLSRWQLVQRKLQDFWKRWSTEYLNLLQVRTKWGDREKEPQENDVVLIKDESLPPAKWPLARILKKHPGNDGITRVVTLKTKNNILKRPVTKIAKLPVESSSSITRHFEPPIAPKKKTSILPIITTMLVLCINCINPAPINAPAPFTTMLFDKPPLIFFEDISAAVTTNTKWNLITYIDLHKFSDELDALHNNLNNFYSNCRDDLIIIDNCENHLNILRDRILRLRYNNEFVINPTSRQKRAPFEIIGYLQRELFGTLDARFAEQYARDIRQLQANNEHLMQLIRNHTSVIDATVNILKKTEEELNTQSQQINAMSDMVKTFTLKISGTTYFSFTLQYISNLLDQYEMQQDSIIHIITNTHEGSVITKLLSTQQLTDQFKLIKNHATQDIQVPEDGLDIIKIITTKLWKINQILIFKITIPLINNNKFTIYKMYPVPIMQNGKYIQIELTATFIMAANDRQQFTFLDKHQLNDCSAYTDHTVLCERPLKFFSHNKESCEWELLNHKPNITTDCPLVVSPVYDALIELQEENHWIFVIHRKFHFSTFCNDIVNHHELNGEGILILNQNCIFKENSIILTGQRVMDNEITPIIMPKTLIQIDTITNQALSVPNSAFNHSEVVAHNFKQIDKQLAAIKQQQQFTTINAHDIHHYGIIYVSIVLVLAFVIYKKCKTQSRSVTTKRCRSLPELSRPQNVESST